jgi:hypothetical protein
MADEDFDFSSYEPSFIQDGYDIIGPQPNYVDEDISQWNTEARTQGADDTYDITSAGSGGLTVQTGPFSGGYLGVVNGVTTITLDETLFLIQDNGGGEVLISLQTTTCP